MASATPLPLRMLPKALPAPVISSTRPEEFYLAVENNYVVVYEADKKTRFMSTGIPVQSLSDELAEELLNFKYVGSEAELYDFLESYSS